MDDQFIYDNEDETEMGQLHSIHFALNSINAVRHNVYAGPSLDKCEDCGDKIALKRKEAISGCRKCVQCQASAEAVKF